MTSTSKKSETEKKTIRVRTGVKAAGYEFGLSRRIYGVVAG